jgi:uncharacterized protein YprB with RNaseH-like and TPR domain
MLPKTGMLDIETSNLDANFGIMLTYAIRDYHSGEVLSGTISSQDIESFPSDKTDTRLVFNLVRDIQGFDTLVTFYGKRFDIPFLRTRALIDDISFPSYGSIKHIDVYDWAKHKLKLNSNRLEVVCRTIFGETEKTHIEYKYWVGATRGDQGSLDWILDHNIRDVNDLCRVYDMLVDFSKRNDTSI